MKEYHLKGYKLAKIAELEKVTLEEALALFTAYFKSEMKKN